MSSQIVRWWLIGSVLLSLVAAPFLARGDANLRKQRRQNQQEIAAMPESERNRLKRNFEAYQNLSEPERQQLRQLHQTLEVNRSQSNDLNETLNTYREWVSTLEPFQRDRLAQLEKPNERIAAMREVVREQIVRSTERALPHIGGPDFFTRAIIARAPTLSVESYNRVMEALEKVALPNLSLEKRAELQDTVGIDRHYRLIKLLAQEDLSDRVRSILTHPPKEFRTVAARFDELVEDSSIREYFREELRIRDRRGPSRRPSDSASVEDDYRVVSNEHKLAGMIGKGLLLELSDVRKQEQKSVNDEQLMSFFETLPEDEKDRLLTLEASDFHSDLVRQFRTQAKADQQDRVSDRDIYELIRFRPFGSNGRPGPPNGEDGPRGFENRERPGFRPPPEDGDRRRPPPEFDDSAPRFERPRGARPERGEF